jgi:hypothetical protein
MDGGGSRWAMMGRELDAIALDAVPDPLPGLADLPLLPRRASPPARPATRSAVARSRMLALAGALLYELAWLGVLNKRGDLHSVGGRTLFVETAIPVVAAVAGLAAGAASGSRGMGVPKARIAAWALAVPAFFAVATVVGGPHDIDAESFWSHGLRCFVLTALFSVGPLALAAHAFRRAFVAVPAWRAAALGAGCAALAATTTSLVCSTGNAAHVLVGHGTMILVAVGLAALLGRRIAQA